MSKKYIPRGKRVAIEFDGTITTLIWPCIGLLQPGAKETLKKFRLDGWTVIIHSTRNNPTFQGNENLQLLKEMKEFLDKHEVPYDYIDDGKNGKVIADKYLSHRSVKFTNWRDAHTQILYNRNAKRNENVRAKRKRDDMTDHMGEI